jgi:hypothetical protein
MTFLYNYALPCALGAAGAALLLVGYAVKLLVMP